MLAAYPPQPRTVGTENAPAFLAWLLDVDPDPGRRVVLADRWARELAELDQAAPAPGPGA